MARIHSSIAIAFALGRIDAEGGWRPHGLDRFRSIREFDTYIRAYWRTTEVILRRQMGIRS